jgi:hypothetical protein
LLTALLDCFIALLEFSLTAFKQALARRQQPVHRVSPVGGIMATFHKTKKYSFSN